MLSELDKGRPACLNERAGSPPAQPCLWRIQLWGSLIKSQVSSAGEIFFISWFRVWLDFIAESSYFLSMTLFISS